MKRIYAAIAPFAAVSLLYAMLGCPSPQSTTIQSIFVSVDAVLAITDPSYDETQLIATENAASAALASWKPGSDSSEAVQALTDFKNVIASITAIPPKYQSIIAIAVNEVDTLIAGVQSPSASAAEAASPQAYKATFNAAIDKQAPELGQAKF